MKVLLILCACALVASAFDLPSLKVLLDRELELLQNPEEVRALLERLAWGNRLGKRLFFSLSSLKSAFSSVVDGVKTAAQAVASGVESAAETVGHGVESAAETVAHGVESAAETVGQAAVSAFHSVEDAAHTVVDKVEGAAEDVAHLVSGAAHDVGQFFSAAAEKLAPLLDAIAQVAGPIAQQIGEVALQELVSHGPELLSMLGEAAVQAAIAAAGKRDVNVEHLAGIFSQAVQMEVNKTVTDVKKTIAALQSMNAELQTAVNKLSNAIQAGGDPRTAASDFLMILVNGLRRMEETGTLSLNLTDVDNIISKSVGKFGHKLKELIMLRTATQEKPSVLSSVVENLQGFLQTGEHQLSNLLGRLESLAQGLLQPTLQNLSSLAQKLLNSAGSVAADHVLQALRVLAPYQEQLGPLFQQLLSLGRGLGAQV